MKHLFFSALLLFGSYSLIFSQTGIFVDCITGSDNLRSGNSVYLSINFTDRTTSEELLFGRYFRQNYRSRTIRLVFARSFTLEEIESINIRHDGAPTNAFENYDNWDLLRLQVRYARGRRAIYNSLRDPRRSAFVHRFTGESRQITLNRQR